MIQIHMIHVYNEFGDIIELIIPLMKIQKLMIINFHGIIIKTLGQRSTFSYIFSLILTLTLKYQPSVKPHCKHSLRSQQSLACTFSSYILILIILSFYFCKLGILLQCEKYIMLLLNRQRKMARTFYPKPARKWRSLLLDDKHKAIKTE